MAHDSKEEARRLISSISPRVTIWDVEARKGKNKPSIVSLVHQAVVLATSYAEVAAFIQTALERQFGEPEWHVVVSRCLAQAARRRKGAYAVLHVPSLAADLPADGVPIPSHAFSVVLFKPAPDALLSPCARDLATGIPLPSASPAAADEGRTGGGEGAEAASPASASAMSGSVSLPAGTALVGTTLGADLPAPGAVAPAAAAAPAAALADTAPARADDATPSTGARAGVSLPHAGAASGAEDGGAAGAGPPAAPLPAGTTPALPRVQAVVAHALASTCGGLLHDDSVVAFAAGLRAALTREYGSTWAVLLGHASSLPRGATPVGPRAAGAEEARGPALVRPAEAARRRAALEAAVRDREERALDASTARLSALKKGAGSAAAAAPAARRKWTTRELQGAAAIDPAAHSPAFRVHAAPGTVLELSIPARLPPAGRGRGGAEAEAVGAGGKEEPGGVGAPLRPPLPLASRTPERYQLLVYQVRAGAGLPSNGDGAGVEGDHTLWGLLATWRGDLGKAVRVVLYACAFAFFLTYAQVLWGADNSCSRLGAHWGIGGAAGGMQGAGTAAATAAGIPLVQRLEREARVAEEFSEPGAELQVALSAGVSTAASTPAPPPSVSSAAEPTYLSWLALAPLPKREGGGAGTTAVGAVAADAHTAWGRLRAGLSSFRAFWNGLFHFDAWSADSAEQEAALLRYLNPLPPEATAWGADLHDAPAGVPTGRGAAAASAGVGTADGQPLQGEASLSVGAMGEGALGAPAPAATAELASAASPRPRHFDPSAYGLPVSCSRADVIAADTRFLRARALVYGCLACIMAASFLRTIGRAVERGRGGAAISAMKREARDAHAAVRSR